MKTGDAWLVRKGKYLGMYNVSTLNVSHAAHDQVVMFIGCSRPSPTQLWYMYLTSEGIAFCSVVDLHNRSTYVYTVNETRDAITGVTGA